MLCHSLLLLAIFTSHSAGTPVEPTTAVNAPLQGAEAGSAPSGTGGGQGQQQQPPSAADTNTSVVSTSYQDTFLNNNGCVYHNGMVTENGRTRKATAEDEAKVKEYLATQRRNQDQFRKEMDEEMKRMMQPPQMMPMDQKSDGGPWQVPQFPQPPFPRMPKMPPMPDTPPCFCANCRNIPSLLSQTFDNSINQSGSSSQQQQSAKLK